MSFKKSSLIALAFTFCMGIIFYVLSFKLPMSIPGMVIGPGYYPRVLSGLLIIFSAIGFIIHLRKADTEAPIQIKKMGLFLMVLGLGIGVAAYWNMTHNFYPAAILATLVMLWMLNPEPASGKKAGKTVLVTAILLGVLYLLFSVVLQLNL